MKYAFGIDVGGTAIKIGLFDVAGNMIEESSIPANVSNGGSAILPDIASEIRDIMAFDGFSTEDISCIGIGLPGPVDDKNVVNKCVNLGWQVTDVGKELSALTGVKLIKAGNDANVAALGEATSGSGVSFNSVCMITLGTGVGGGLIISGSILNGAHGAAGEIGHITVPSDEKRICTCGKINCLEQFSSAGAIERKTGRSCKEVFEDAKNGDMGSIAVVDEAVEKLAIAMGSISCVCDVDCFIIGGGMSKAGDFLLEKIRAAYPPYAFHASRGTKILPATLGNKAGMYGAVRMALDLL